MSEAEPSGLERARTVAAREKEAYEAGSDRPVGSFLAIMGVYLPASAASPSSCAGGVACCPSGSGWPIWPS